MTDRRHQSELSPRAARTAMPRPLSRAERAAFVARLLTKLPGPDEDPVSTTDLGDYFGLDAYQRDMLWNCLARLARDGAVERIVRPGEGVRYWRRTPAGEQQTSDTITPQRLPVTPSALGLPGMPTLPRDHSPRRAQ